MGGKDGVASCSKEFKYLDVLWKMSTHAATRTPKMRVMIAKSTRSRLDMQASDDSGSCPNMARTKGESDWYFFVAANAALKKIKNRAIVGSGSVLTWRCRRGFTHEKDERSYCSGYYGQNENLCKA